jgi:D-alanine-D-alanine ligase
MKPISPLPERVHYTSISCSEGRRLGFGDDELGEFDDDETLAQIEAALADLGVEAIRLGWGGALLEELVRSPPGLLWNLNSGILGEVRTAQVAALCEMLAIPLVGPGSWTAGLVQDKTATHAFVAQSGVAITSPQGVLISEEGDVGPRGRPFAGPYILKPNNDESSRGLEFVDGDVSWSRVVDSIVRGIRTWGPIRLERFVKGLDVSANAAADGGGHLIALEPMVVDHGATVYGAAEKTRMQHRLVPLRELHESMANSVMGLVDKLSRILRFRHYARFDFRCDLQSGSIVFLEANYCPCFDRSGDFALAAAASGIGYDQLLSRILADAERDARANSWFANLPAGVRKAWRAEDLAAHIRDA